ncbi:MAG: MBL fold metallo-hydrolase [Acidiferrobacterales bacterium]|nr:MBL fold metallo-hydrolase [Acidiferrobacterales bacterium]
MKKQQILIQIVMMIALFNVSTVHSQTSETQLSDIIYKVEKAYGGDKLRNLKYFGYEDEYRERYPDMGFAPEYDNFWEVKARMYHDLINEKGSGESYTEMYGRIMQYHNQSVDDGIAYIDYQQGVYRMLPDANYYSMFGRNIRASDTLLAFELVRKRNKKILAEPVNYLGKEYQQVILELPESPPLYLYINEDGLIKRMNRTYTNGDDVIYVFENHSVWGGISYAREFQLFINGEFLVITTNRKLLLGTAPKDTFKLAKGLEPEPELFTTEEMTVVPISEKLHHVGQEDYSSFYDAGDYIIGLGAYEGFKVRFEAYQNELSHNKPLRFVIPTHHHANHLAGLSDAIEMGATVLIPDRLKEKVMLDFKNISEEQIRTFNKNETLDGLQLYTLTTPNTIVLTVIYDPQSKTLFQAEQYGGFFKNQPNKLTRNSYALYQGLKALSLDIENLLSVYVGKVEKWDDIESAAKNYTHTDCYFKRDVCPTQSKDI